MSTDSPQFTTPTQLTTPRRLGSWATSAALIGVCLIGATGCGSSSNASTPAPASTSAASGSMSPSSSDMPSSSTQSSSMSSSSGSASTSTPVWGATTGAGVQISEGYAFATGTAMPNPSGGASANATGNASANATSGMGGMGSGGGMSAMSAAYFTITNTTAQPVVLQQVRCATGCTAQIHTTVSKGGGSSMHEISSITIAGHGHHDLAPGGDHIMLTHLDAPLVQGGTLTLVLRFSTGSVTVNLPVISREQRPHA